MQRRGQTTTYIIIGLIIAAMLITLYAYKGKIILPKEEALVVPAQAKNIKIQIDSCLDKISEEAATIAGLQGGYITLPTEIPVSGSNPFSNALQLPGDMRVAYWFYETANGIKKNQIPSKEDIELQMAQYIDSKLPECAIRVAKNFDGDMEMGVPSTTVDIRDDKVEINTRYIISVTKGDFEFTFKEFDTQLNYRLGRLYKIAKEIMQAENKDFYLEEKTIDILSLYDDIPYSDTTFECGMKIWTKEGVEQALRNALLVNIPKIKIKDSANPNGDTYYDWDIGNRADGIKINLNYFKNWPISMDVFPSEGNILRADQLNQRLGNRAVAFLTSLFCITNYNFVYDVKYPILISLRDNKGYIFQFATQVVIDNNQPRENEFGTSEPLETEKKICASASVPITITVLSEQPDGTLEPVDNAEVSFKCINEVCALGKTRKIKSESRLLALLPACINGLITAKKDGYYDGKEFIDSNKPGSATVIMSKIYPLKLNIRVIEDGVERELGDDEKAVIYLEEKSKGYVVSVADTQDKIELIPGDYTIKSTLIGESSFGITIKGKEITKCVSSPSGLLGILGFEKKKCATSRIPDTTINSAVEGGGETFWSVSAEDLSKASEIITFYVNSEGTPSTYEDMEKIYEKVESMAVAPPELS